MDQPPKRSLSLDSWWLDLKLGARMLVKHPGLALIGGFGIAVGVAIAAGAYSVIHGAFLSPTLPLDEGDRIVSLEVWDAAASKPEPRILHDYRLWLDELGSVEDLGAFRALTPNLIEPGVPPASVQVAAISASGFRVARVQPLLGRALTEDDERGGAPWVVVIGESIWRNRFAADPNILGRTIQLGVTPHTIVGVMPDALAFPLNHRFWTPLRLDSEPPGPLAGPNLFVFGRLTPGATLASAQAELETLGRRAALAAPKLYEHLQPRVLPYANPFMGVHEYRDVAGLQFMQGIVLTLLVLVCLNVSILVYSRTVTRQAEIAVRTALGAGRGRIVAQLFLEALVLSAVAAAAGIAIAELALRQAAGATLAIASQLPFWISFHLSPQSVLYAGALSVLAAAIVGVAPALQATRRDVQSGLRVIGAGGSGMRLGTTWTLLIVAQVACAVALLPAAVSGAWWSMASGFADPGFRAEEFLSAQLGMDGASAAHFAGRQEELTRRLEAEPRISGVTFAMIDPGEERFARIETQGVTGQPQPERRDVRFNRVDVDFFGVFDVAILAGRGFQESDIPSAGESGVVVVNESFAKLVFGGDALGRRIRYAVDEMGAVATHPSRAREQAVTSPWYEIVGIVSAFPAAALDFSPLTLYHPVAPGDAQPVSLALHLRDGDPSTFAGRLQEIAAAIDPELHLRQVVSLDESLRRDQWIRRIEGGTLAAMTLTVVMLSAAGIYSLMSINVSQRRKEIGIRMALGAHRTRVVASIFARALGQLAAGAAVGVAVAAALEQRGNLMRDDEAIVLPAVALFMMGVGLLAALGPARRCLAIEPTEALREQ